MYEFVIKNGNIIDGTGGAAYKADVAIVDGKIARIGHIPESAAHSAIEAEGRAVTPGFIDIHRHGDMAAFRDNFGALELHQGLTTVINGNCGGRAERRHSQGRHPWIRATKVCSTTCAR